MKSAMVLLLIIDERRNSLRQIINPNEIKAQGKSLHGIGTVLSNRVKGKGD